MHLFPRTLWAGIENPREEKAQHLIRVCVAALLALGLVILALKKRHIWFTSQPHAAPRTALLHLRGGRTCALGVQVRRRIHARAHTHACVREPRARVRARLAPDGVLL